MQKKIWQSFGSKEEENKEELLKLSLYIPDQLITTVRKMATNRQDDDVASQTL